MIRKAEQASGTRRVPIIAVTAHALASDRDRCIAAGMDGYVSKPITPAALHTEIERVTLGARSSGLADLRVPQKG
jgi:CheY-like chemotaxis protein